MPWVPDVRKTLGGSILFFHTLTWWARTTREGGAAASAPKCAEDDGEASDISVNDLGDGGAVMRALRCSQPWEAEAGGPAGAGLVLAAGGRQD